MNRRTLLSGGAGALAASSAYPPAVSRAQGRPKPLVLIHGAWHGGWCWDRIMTPLSAGGRSVSAVTLTGCGERRHLIAQSVTLDTHIQDVVEHIEAEELQNVALVAHSYGGFVATGVVDALGERIANVVMLDAFVPKHGERVADYAGSQRAAQIAESAERDPNFNLAPPPASALGVSDAADVAWVTRRMTPHPVATYLQPIALRQGLEKIPRKTYVACDKGRLPVFDSTKERIRADGGWRYVAMDTGHDAMVAAPGALADVLLAALA